ncbi:MAG: tetratricopeptide repeat protein [Candidatus Binatia bacterium]
MRRLVLGSAFAVALTLFLGSLAARAFAQEPKPPEKAGEKEKEKGEKKGATVDPATGKRLNEAVEHINGQRYGEARASLGKLSLDRLSPYELSRVEQLYAAVDQSEGKYGSARDHLNKAIASGGLNDQEMSTARFQIAQLFMAENKWKDGVEALKQWFATTPNPNSAAYHLLAVGYYQLGDFKSALEPAQKAIDLAGGKPQESWLQLLLALRLEREEYQLAVPILKQLIDSGPAKKNYWIQLSAVHAQLGSYEQSVVPLQLSYQAGLLTEDQEIRRLAEMLARVTIPYRAAKILSQAIEQGKIKSDFKAFELLANCWVAAREYDKSIPPLRRAAELSDSGELFLRLAEVYVQREDWGNTAGAVKLALDKGKLKSPGNAQLLMGLAHYNQKKMNEARTWFERARGHGDSRQQAEAWIGHISGTEALAQSRSETAAAAPAKAP